MQSSWAMSAFYARNTETDRCEGIVDAFNKIMLPARKPLTGCTREYSSSE